MRQRLLLDGLRRRGVLVALLSGVAGGAGLAQTPATTDPQAPPPQGEVVIQSHGEPPAPGQPDPAAAEPSIGKAVEGTDVKVDLNDAERSAPLITAYDLDARLRPVSSGLDVRARLTVQNSGQVPLNKLALQISSTLHWNSATLVEDGKRTELALAQHRLDTDTDHTGAETEIVLPLPAPLAPGASVNLDLFYSGTVPRSGGRLQRLGANAAQQASTDWDAISPDWTGLRGFGDVLWYPVASPQLFLAEGNTLFEAVGRARLREESARVHLHLSLEYTGEAPAAAYFCGRRQALHAVSDAPDLPTETGAGIASADFPAEPLGFRTLNLFVLNRAETSPAPAGPEAAQAASPSQPTPTSQATSTSQAGESSSSQPAVDAPQVETFAPPGAPVAVATNDPAVAESFAAAVNHVAPLLREWLGPRPLSVLTAIDEPGQPFQDGPLLVGPLALLETSPHASGLAESLTHAWVQTGQPWMDEGLAQFFALLWIERENGREAANAALTELMRPVTLVEPDSTEAAGTGDAAATSVRSGQPLTDAWSDVFYRRKAAAVWWMMRGLVGDGNLHAALAAWHTQGASQQSAVDQALAFQHLLEKTSGQDLGWFFSDWVLHDRGLPDLSISDVGVGAEPAGTGHGAGFLVAITVKNAGEAAAEVPLIVRSGRTQVVRQLRIAGQTSRTDRVLVESAPTEVQVNDGSTPELVSSTHTRDISLKAR